jgi:Glutathione S-transferase, N-terminal domain
MAFRLYRWSISTCTCRMALKAKERNLPYELIHVNLQAGEQHKQPAYLAHQPFGKIPYIGASFFVPRFPYRFRVRCGGVICFRLSSSSRTTASSYSSRVLSVATSRPSDPAQSESPPTPRPTPSSSKRRAWSIPSLSRSRLALLEKGCSSCSAGRRRTRSASRSSSLSWKVSWIHTMGSWGGKSTLLVMYVFFD